MTTYQPIPAWLALAYLRRLLGDDVPTGVAYVYVIGLQCAPCESGYYLQAGYFGLEGVRVIQGEQAA